jgi:hypothetical protein
VLKHRAMKMFGGGRGCGGVAFRIVIIIIIIIIDQPRGLVVRASDY